MLRSRDISVIASAVARRLSSRRLVSALSPRRSSELRLTSAIVARLSRRGGLSERQIASGVVARLSGRSSRISERRIASIVAARLTSSVAVRLASPRTSTIRLASAVANTLGRQPELRQRARFSVDAAASAVARRLRLGNFPVNAVASAVARRLSIQGGVRGSDAFVSSVAARLTGREGAALPLNQEVDPKSKRGK